MNDNNLEVQLRAHPFSRGMRPKHIDSLLDHAEPVRFGESEVVFRAGDDAATFYLIITGLVDLMVATASAPRHIETLAEGSVLGWSWLFTPRIWKFDALAKTPVRAIAIDGPGLLETCQTDFEFGYVLVSRIAEAMADRLQNTRREVRDLAGP